jgi:uncharacterized membrane protein
MLTPLPFTRTTLIVALLVIGAGAWLLELRTRGIEPVLNWLRDQQRSVLAFEIIFLGGFILFAVLRAHAPAVAATEKPMDMAFLNGFMAAQTLPTQDTWMAGMSVPYYHFGYFVLACLGKITGAPPGVAYNLAAATVPALAMVSLAALAWNLARAAPVDPVRIPAGPRRGYRRRQPDARDQPEALRQQRHARAMAADRHLLVVQRLARHSQPATGWHQ